MTSPALLYKRILFLGSFVSLAAQADPIQLGGGEISALMGCTSAAGRLEQSLKAKKTTSGYCQQLQAVHSACCGNPKIHPMLESLVLKKYALRARDVCHVSFALVESCKDSPQCIEGLWAQYAALSKPDRKALHKIPTQPWPSDWEKAARACARNHPFVTIKLPTVPRDKNHPALTFIAKLHQRCLALKAKEKPANGAKNPL